MRDHLSVLLEKIYKWRFLGENLEEFVFTWEGFSFSSKFLNYPIEEKYV